MSAPNPDDPLAENVAKNWRDNEPEALATGVSRYSCCFPGWLVVSGLHACMLIWRQCDADRSTVEGQLSDPAAPINKHTAREWTRLYAVA